MKTEIKLLDKIKIKGQDKVIENFLKPGDIFGLSEKARCWVVIKRQRGDEFIKLAIGQDGYGDEINNFLLQLKHLMPKETLEKIKIFGNAISEPNLLKDLNFKKGSLVNSPLFGESGEVTQDEAIEFIIE